MADTDPDPALPTLDVRCPLDPQDGHEWLLTNGIGGYACGSVAGTLDRRYHGLLIAPAHPPLGRCLLFGKADAVLLDDAAEVPLHSNRWAGDVIEPSGHRHVASFHLDRQVPVWRFAVGDTHIEQRIWMTHGRNQTQVAFRLVAGAPGATRRLRLGLLAGFRDHHAVHGVPGPAIDSAERDGDLLLSLPGSLRLRIQAQHGVLTRDHTWVERFLLVTERARGLEDTERQLRVGFAELTLQAGRWSGIRITLDDAETGPDPDPDLAQSLEAALRRCDALAARALPGLGPTHVPGWLRRLALAADAYLIQRRQPGQHDRRSVIAGYPWFGDWGRDTMIALPGLTLACGRPQLAREILETFAGYVSEGMLPNVFPGSGETPEYNTVDAALWFIEAWRAYVDETGDLEALRRAFPRLREIIGAYRDGTRFGIRMDPADGLISAGVPGQQLTWMDARAAGREVTPRHGKPVEINALWYNALRVMADFAARLGLPADDFDQLAGRVRDGFARFTGAPGQGLYDVLDGPQGHDGAIRPNQIFAVSLPHSPLASDALRRDVVEVCRAHLLTPYGLRSLAPGDAHYQGRYGGGVEQRDGSYHQGPVWGWLLGHYALAEYRVLGDAALARQRLAPMAEQLQQAVVGQVGEIFDGDPPHHPRGAPAQAWSVACTLDAWWRLQRLATQQDGQVSMEHGMNAERERLEQQRRGTHDWRLWGPYLAERAWGTVREDYSANGTAWEYFDHDQARSRAYRWNEDGLGGICDASQYLCLALALWNGRDPILKERAFGLTGNQGNRGEDVKEYYFYRDATPTHSLLRYLYKYPQQAYPYQRLVTENATRGRQRPPFNLLDSGVMHDGRYWDVELHYAKAAPDEIHVRIYARNHGPEPAELHLLPTLWFRNTWSWEPAAGTRPDLASAPPPAGCSWAVAARHAELGDYWLYGAQPAQSLFTENDSNPARLWGAADAGGHYKDAFHRHVIDGEVTAVNPQAHGTRFAAWSRHAVEPGQRVRLDLVLSARRLERPFANSEVVFAARRSEADVYYDDMLPEAGPEDMRILRQAMAGMVWTKQFFHFDVERWLRGDRVPPPAGRRHGRNRHWRHLKARDVISMPDKWEYPWFAAWDLAYHCAALALVDVDFAKDQIELMLSERYLHPNGQIPAYEWAFGDVNPPVHAMGALKVFRAERVQRGQGDLHFLQRVFSKLLLNFAWWINRKDAHGHNLFEGGFLGLDNISVFDRSRPLPPGYSLKQADATGWMAMFALNLTVMALELCAEDPDHEDMAIQCYLQFLAIAEAIAGREGEEIPSLWDTASGFFKDLLITPDGSAHRVDVYSWVGLIPLFATEIIDRRLLANAPRFRELLRQGKGGLFRGNYICACPEWQNERGERLLALVDHSMLPRILERLLDEAQFLSPYGVRSLSKVHAGHSHLGYLPGIGEAVIEYVPGESNTGLFGGNSNWRGPVWLPTNYSLIQAIERFHRFLGPAFTVEAPCLGGRRINLQQVANLLSDRLVDLYRRNSDGAIPALRRDSPFQQDPAWRDLAFYYEYFHAETGQGLGAAHQTGWTGLLANLVMRKYQKDVTPWSGLDAGERAAWMDELA